ncbi:MAG: hypothetical protein K8S18_01980, partial [Desulfobacula sp.]|nr:hypothetical protein [Desulfobacula sp.]
MIKKIVMAVFLVLILHSQAFAGIKVVPAIIRVTLPPGGTYNTEIWIQNSSRERVEYVKVYLESNEKNPEGKWKYDKGTGGIMSMIPWTSVTPGTLSIQPGGKARIALRLNIPKRAYGDYRVALMLEQDRSKSPLPDKEMDIEDILLKKHRKERVPEETRLRLTQGVRIAVPVHVRAMAKSASAKRVVPQIKLKNLNMGIAGDGKGAFQTTLMVENTGSFDIEATGACKLLHGTKKSMLKITDLSGEKIVIMPKSKRLLKFIFSDSLPVGDYIASVNLKIKNRGFEKIVRKGIKASFKIDNTMAESLAKLAAAGNSGGDTPSVPLLVDPGRINLISRGARIKPLKLTVTNPTNQTLNIRSIFRSASQSKKGKPSVKIISDRFSIEPGKSERIRVEIKPAG